MATFMVFPSFQLSSLKYYDAAFDRGGRSYSTFTTTTQNGRILLLHLPGPDSTPFFYRRYAAFSELQKILNRMARFLLCLSALSFSVAKLLMFRVRRTVPVVQPRRRKPVGVGASPYVVLRDSPGLVSPLLAWSWLFP